MTASAIAQRITPPEGLQARHVLAGAHRALADGVAPRDGVVLDRARRLAQAETPAAVEAWDAARPLLLRVLPEWSMQMWLCPVMVCEHDGVLVLLLPDKRVRWAQQRYGRLVLDVVRSVSEFGSVAFRPVSGPRPAGRTAGGVR